MIKKELLRTSVDSLFASNHLVQHNKIIMRLQRDINSNTIHIQIVYYFPLKLHFAFYKRIIRIIKYNIQIEPNKINYNILC